MTVATVLIGVVALGTSCLVPEDLSECDTDDDCRAQYSKASYCADDGVCETYTREEYLAPPCDYETYGEPYESDDPVIGAILAGPANNDNLLTALEVAYEEFQNAPNVNLSVVVCTSKSQNDRARKAANHLAQIGVEAIVGPDSSTQVIELGEDVFIPNQMMSVSPAATSAVISNIEDDDLLWRTIPSDTFQADALGKLALSRLNLATDATSLGDKKLLVAAKSGDPYSQGLRSGVIDTVSTDITTSSNFKTVNFTNSDNVTGEPSYADVGQEIANFDPDVALVFGTEEIWSVIEKTEESYGSGAERPLYVTADGGRVEVEENDSGKARTAIEAYPDLAANSRVIGTKPATNYAGNQVYASFANSWEDKKNLGPNQSAAGFPFIAEAYDAFFMLGLASVGADQFTGPALAEQIPEMSDPNGEILDAQATDISVVRNKFSNDESFQLRGATGPLDFDDNGNPVSGTVALWCLEGDTAEQATISQVPDYLVEPGTGFTERQCPNDSSQGN
jgi:branched-chain amino acid transport system substrate-binding protein